MRELHSLLKRQLKRYSGQTDQRFVGETDLLQAINDAYWQFDADREMLEHSMELTSQELLETNSALQKANQDLEKNVVERTANLNSVNEQLHMELAERKRVEDVLRESEARYHGLFEESPISLWQEDFSEVKVRLDELRGQGVTDFRAYLEEHPQVVAECAMLVKIADVNHVTLKLFGAESKPELLQNLDRIFGAESYEGFREELAQIAEGRTQFQWEGVNQTLAGKRVDVLLQWSVVSGYEDTLSQVIISLQDITERKQAEQTLSKSEALYRQAIEVAGAVPYYESYYEDGRRIKYEFIGEGIRDITGYGPEEFNSTLWDSLVLDIHLVNDLSGYSLDEAIQRVRSGATSIWRCEHRIRHRDGEIRWVFEAAVELRDEHGVSHGSIGMYQDITERKQAEEFLKIAEEKYRDLVERLPLVVYISELGRDGVWSYVSPQLEGLLGFTPQEWMADPTIWYRQVHPEDLDRQMLLEEEAHAMGKPFESEYRIFTKDGREIWIRDSGRVIKQENGKAPIVQGVLVDITSRKQTENALRDREQRLNAIIENEPECIKLLAPDGTILQMNPAGLAMIEADGAQSVVGKSVYPLITPAHRQAFRDLTEGVSRGESGKLEFEIVGLKGTRRWLDTHAVPMRNEKGEAIGLLGITRDVTERKRAEQELAHLNRQTELILNSVGEGIFGVDIHGKLTFINPAMTDMLGWESVELLGRPGHETFHHTRPDGRPYPRDECPIYMAFRDGKTHRVYDEVFWRKDRSSFPVEYTSKPILEGDQLIGAVVAVNDITERKRADAKIRQYADIVENMKLGLYVFHLEKRDDDSSLRLALANPAALQISGTTADEVIGTYLDESFPELREMGIPQKYAQVVRTGEALELEVIYYDDFQVMETVYAVKAFPLPDDHVGVAFESITERKKAEDELRASEERFRQLANNLEEVFWIADPQSKTDLYISPAYERVWGRPTDAQYQNPDTFIESVMPEDRDTVLTALGRQEQGEKTEMEYRISRPDGSVRWIWDRAFPIFDETGKLTRVAGIAADVTNRKQTEEALQDREQRLQAIIFASPLAIISYHADGMVKAWNPAAERMFGWSETETLGQLPPLITEADLEEFHSLRERVIGGETILGIELKQHKKDATLVDVSVNLAPTSDLDGQVDGYISLIEDITERRRAEETLRESEARYRGLFENLVNGFALHHIITDDQGKPVDYVFLEVNPAFEKLTGISAEQAIGRRVTEVLPGIENDPFIQIYGQVALTGEPVHLEEFSSSLNKYYEINAYSPARGQFAVTFADITERKLAEKEITRNLLELEALHENGLAIGRLLEPRGIGERIIDTFQQYLSWHHVTIRLRKEDTDDLELIAFNLPSLKEEERAEVEKIFNSRINKVGQGMSGWVVQTGRPIRTGDVRDHSQYVGTHAGIQSGLYMPLKIGERTIGCISVESELADAFSVQDERLLSTLANQAAIAFENARLFQTAQQELTERKRMEDELRASQERYQTLVETSPDGIGMITLGGTVLFANEKMDDLFKTAEPSELIGTNLPFLFAPEEQTRMIENLGKAISQGSDFNEYWMTRKDHSRFYGDVRIRMTRDRMGQPDKAILQIRDITERKLTQTAIQEERQHFLNMFENSPVATWLEDFGAVAVWMDQLREQGIEDLRNYLVSHPEEYKNALSMIRIIDVNQAAVTMNGAKSKTHLLENVHRLMIGETPSQSLIIEFLMLWKGHTSFEFELTNRTLEGKSINAILHIYIPSTDGKPDLTRVIVTSTDITDRKQMEIALQDERNLLAMRVEERTADLSRANENLARALRVKDEFLANMSHELRTPLNAILGLSESLAEQIAGPLNNKQQNYVSTIGESGHHLLALINDILDLAKIEAGQITLDITKVDVHSVCQASLRLVKQQAQKKNQDVTLEIDENFGLIWADERRLKQMIVNLMSNAVKFTPENGKIGLEVHGDQGENRVLITVWDSGIGIEENDLSQLFQPFVQLDSGLARETSGTGLGLALVAQMARLHGGSVSVASIPGEGSRFTLVIPWQPALSADTIERMKVTGKFRAIKLNAERQETILLIEDTEEVILVVRDYLELSGYNMVVAKDGLDGITQAKLIHPDLILMDLQMPRMNGIEATQKLRSDPDFQYTPIIALTALAMPNDRERCLAAGMDEYITKPVNLRALIKIIQGFLSHNPEYKSS